MRVSIACLIFAIPALFAQAQNRAVLTGSAIRVEAVVAGGKLQERFFARQGAGWVEVAVSSGRSLGALSIEGASAPRTDIVLSAGRDALVENLKIGDLGIRRTLSLIGDGPWLKVTSRLETGLPVSLHSFSDRFRASMPPDWSYSPSIGGFNSDAQYKAPLILVQSGRRAFGIVPNVSALTRDILKRCDHAIDLDAPAGPLLSVGFIPARLSFHAVYREDIDRVWTAQEPVENSYFLYLSANSQPGEAYRDAVRFHWNQFGRKAIPEAASGQAGTGSDYKQCGLWDDWRRAVWLEESRKQWLSFTLPGGAIGGAVRTVRWGRPLPSVYLSAWFNSMRTAYGMALYARRNGNKQVLELAEQTLNVALNAPGKDGAFKCIAVPQGDGAPVKWAAGDGSGASVASGFLGFDMSWTGYWMLKWREAQLPGAEAVLDRCARLAQFLIARQGPDGMLPTRFGDNGDVQEGLARAVKAETAPVALFLLELYKASPNKEYLDAARKGLAFLDKNVIPNRQWYDFETFWSCSPRLDVFDERSRQWPANNLALIHAAHAYLKAYHITQEHSYLAKGRALLDYLLLYQQSWTNPALEGLSGSAMLLGGFTTQNSDAEWSDARQSLAGNVLLDYYRATGDAEYLERGVEALRSQFPVSPSENWAHTGVGNKAGVSSFHWGSGSGMAGVEIEQDFLGDAVFDVAAKRGAGVNGLNLTATDVQGERILFRLDSPFRWNRSPRVVFRHAIPDDFTRSMSMAASQENSVERTWKPAFRFRCRTKINGVPARIRSERRPALAYSLRSERRCPVGHYLFTDGYAAKLFY